MPRRNDFSNSEMQGMICVFAQADFNRLTKAGDAYNHIQTETTKS